MEILWIIIAAIGGLLAGGIPVWLIGRSQRVMLRERLVAVQQELENSRVGLDQKNERISGLNQSIVRLETTLEHERRVSGEKVAILDDATQ
ncbi:MAG TPA: DNA recombination protein RmuC, partial [Candidatus Wunengus sp. YC60]